MDNETFYQLIEQINLLTEEYGYLVSFASVNEDKNGEVIDVKIRKEEE